MQIDGDALNSTVISGLASDNAALRVEILRLQAMLAAVLKTTETEETPDDD